MAGAPASDRRSTRSQAKTDARNCEPCFRDIGRKRTCAGPKTSSKSMMELLRSRASTAGSRREILKPSPLDHLLGQAGQTLDQRAQEQQHVENGIGSDLRDKVTHRLHVRPTPLIKPSADRSRVSGQDCKALHKGVA